MCGYVSVSVYGVWVYEYVCVVREYIWCVCMLCMRVCV